MISHKTIKKLIFLLVLPFLLSSCADLIKNRGDARKSPPDPKLRVKKNLEEGRGFRLMDSVNTNKGSGNFEFASSNEMWRASLDTIDFIPLSSVNYSGGIIITDWYSTNPVDNESIKISIRFLTNEIRSDALDIKVFKKICDEMNKCIIKDSSGELINELKRKILRTAKIYEVKNKEENFKPYDSIDITK